MADKMLNAFDVWITAQGVKSRTRLRSVDNVSLEGIEKLRELILEFAIQGKLTSRNSDDEPAHELLKKIQLERENLVKIGVIRKERDFPEVSKSEKPFELPETWEWVRIDTVGHDWGQKEPKSEFNYIEVSGIDSDKGIINSTELLAAESAPSRARKIVKKGTVIYSTVRPYLKNICVVDREFSPEPIASTAFAVLHPFQSMPGKYFFYYLRSPTFVKYVESVQIGVAYPAINDKQFFGGLVPLPPLAEQHRIVAKVDELMALCDALEQQETHHLKSHQLLVETLLGTLTRAADANEFQQAWNKLYEHFNDLFTTEDSIDQLKQTILQLAVMGKLVPQDPNDEPASELLRRIAEERERLVEEGMIKKQKEFSQPLIEDENLDLPNGWVWTSLSQVCQINPRNEAEENLDASFIPMSMVSTSHTGQHEFEIKKWGDIKSGFTHFADGDIGIAKITPCFENSKAILLSGLKNGIGAGTTELFIARPYGETINQRYILLYLKSPEYLRIGESKMTGTAGQKRLSRSFFEGNPLPLPPLNEQKRIVSKVDDLFALCDSLKARITEVQKVANQMAEGVVAEVG